MPFEIHKALSIPKETVGKPQKALYILPGGGYLPCCRTVYCLETVIGLRGGIYPAFELALFWFKKDGIRQQIFVSQYLGTWNIMLLYFPRSKAMWFWVPPGTQWGSQYLVSSTKSFSSSFWLLWVWDGLCHPMNLSKCTDHATTPIIKS